jgi:hypothetical protein
MIKAYILVVLAKLKYSSLTALILSPLSIILDYFNRSFLGDREFMIVVAGAIMIDLSVGIYKHMKFNTFDHRQMLIGMVEKVFISLMALLIFGVFSFILTDGKTNQGFVSQYFFITGRLIVMIYIVLPTFVNMNIITDGKFPPTRFIRYIRKYNETLDITDITEKPKS